MTLSRKAYRLKGLFLAIALTAQAAAGAVLTGVVRGEDGKVVPGLRVTAIGIFAGASGTFSASSGSDGKYSMLNIPPGRYEVCAAAPSSDYLDSCFWAMPELSPIIVTASSQAVSRDLVVKRAGKITLRLNDNANLLDGRTPNGKAGGGHVMMGILTPKGLYVSTVEASSDASGVNHTVSIPYDQPVKLLVSSDKLVMEKDDGTKLDTKGSTIIVQTGKPNATQSTPGPPAAIVTINLKGIRP